MAEGSDAPFQTNADQIAEALLTLGAALKEELMPFTIQIETEIEGEIEALYGPHLAKHWQVDGTTAELQTGELAHIVTSTSDPIVLGYEHGIPPHEIWAHNIALKFEKNGELLYRRMVHHPGTKGKDLAPTLEEGIATFAEVGWQEGLDAIITAWNDEL